MLSTPSTITCTSPLAFGIETEMVSSSPAFTEGIVTFTSGDDFSAASTVMFEASAGA